MKKKIAVLCGLSGIMSWLPLSGVTTSQPAGDNTLASADRVQFSQVATSRTLNGDQLFLGGTVGTGKKEYAISKATPTVDVNTGKVNVTISPLATKAVTENGAAVDPSDLYGSVVKNIATFNSLQPAVVVDGKNNVYLISDTDKGLTTYRTANDTIKDANDDEIDTIPVALAASSDTIFAAVSQQTKTFGAVDGNKRGVAVIKKEAAALVAKKAADLSNAAGEAAQLDALAAAQVVAFNDGGGAGQIVNAAFNDSASLHWNNNLNQLYIGLQNIKRDSQNKAGGVLTVARGAFDNPAAPTSFGLKSIIDSPDKAQFYDDTQPNSANVSDAIIGFYYDGANAAGGVYANNGNDNFSLSTDIIRSMATSTEKNYLIVNGIRPATNVNVGGILLGVPGANNLYALPLLGEDIVGGTGTKGALSKVNTADKIANTTIIGYATFDEYPAALNEMPRESFAAAKVGGQKQPVGGVGLKDVFIDGDTVYGCFAGDNAANVGVFQSTALFNADGAIFAWTPAQRVIGQVDRVFGSLYDNTTGSYLYLTDHSGFVFNNPLATSDFDTVKLSLWGKGDNKNTGSLNAVLSTLFPLEDGGVHQIFTFDEETPGFFTGGFSTMVAVGLDKIALIQTGGIDTAQFKPTETYILNTNVFEFSDAALDNLGPVCTVDFARSIDTNEGWLFVGGYNGVSVLRTTVGAGFASQGPGLAILSGAAGAANYPGDTFTAFKKLAPSNGSKFDHVRKLASLRFGAGAGDTRLYVMTDKSLFMITMAANKFDNAPGTASTAPLNETPIALPGLPDNARLTDFIPIKGQAGVNGFRAFLATSAGLFLVAHTGTGVSFTEIEVDGKKGTPIVQLQYLSMTKGVPSSQGNLVVLAADMSQVITTGKVYRYFVDADQAPANTIAPVVDSAVDLSEFRGNIFYDGSMVLNARAKHFDDTNYLNLFGSNELNNTITPLLDIDTTQNTLVGSPIRDTASGALVVSGDWGVRVNE